MEKSKHRIFIYSPVGEFSTEFEEDMNIPLMGVGIGICLGRVTFRQMLIFVMEVDYE